MSRVRHLSAEEVLADRQRILDGLGVTLEHLVDRAHKGLLYGDEWFGWAEVEALSWLLGEEFDHVN